MRVLAKQTAIMTFVIFLAACASKPNTFANADPTVDFASFQSFGFFKTLSTDEAQYQSLVSNFLKVAVAQEMVRRDISHDEVNPDLRVNFYINTQEKIRTRQVPTSGGYYDYRDPFYDPWIGYGGPAYETRVDQYTEGTLNIDVVDAKTNKLVWEGAVAGRITDKDVRNMEQTIDEAVGAIMVNFPILPGGSQ